MEDKRVVVVIEDDALPRLQASELFDLGGMAVQSFATGEEAIAFVRSNKEAVACIFTDLKLGEGADGLEVVRSVSRELPGVTIVLTSGKLSERPAGLPDSIRFLPKPWAPSDVMDAIRAAERREQRST